MTLGKLIRHQQTYDFHRHRVAEYPVESKAVELSEKPGGVGVISSTITLS
ncbi:unnamed protein product [Lupinus luteus]|uniref:Uncharacterized protein n=1 Tax=Lupinus luteus TaxID=3873 RepID=A0AAV1XAK1_LUPLU